MRNHFRALALLAPMVVLVACGSGSSTSGGGTQAGQTTSPAASQSPEPSASSRLVVLGNDGEVELQRNGETVSVQCDGPGDVDIEADGVVVTTTGTCGAISIDGRNNVVTIAEVVQLEVDGTENQVKAATAAKVDVDGSKNVLDVGTIEREIHVQGSQHSINYGGNPRTDFHQDQAGGIITGSSDDSDATGDDGANEKENEPDEPGGNDA